MNTKIAAIVLATITFFLAGANQVSAQDKPLHPYNLPKADTVTLHNLARDFMSSKTNTPESDLTISQKAISISDSLSIISFIGEDFSDHSSRIDRCYVGIYDASKKLLSVVNRKYKSGSSEDSTPCTKIDLYSTGKDSTGKPWISFTSTYSNPQAGENQDDDIVEIYVLDQQQNMLCYDEKLTDQVNSSIDNPSASKVQNFLSSKKISSTEECN